MYKIVVESEYDDEEELFRLELEINKDFYLASKDVDSELVLARLDRGLDPFKTPVRSTRTFTPIIKRG